MTHKKGVIYQFLLITIIDSKYCYDRNHFIVQMFIAFLIQGRIRTIVIALDIIKNRYQVPGTGKRDKNIEEFFNI